MILLIVITENQPAVNTKKHPPVYDKVHDLRHTYAVNGLMADDDIKTLSENLGHYSVAFTLTAMAM